MKQLKISKNFTSKDTESLDFYFKEIMRIKLLTSDEETDLSLKAYNGDVAAKNKLVECNLRFVVSVAKQYQNQGILLEDLINEGNFGLIKAADKFDPSKGFKFISYAVWWIRQSILQTILENSRIVRIPANQILNLHKVNRAAVSLEQELEREPSESELEQCLEDLNIKVKDLLTYNLKATSLDAPVRDDDEGFTYMDFVSNSKSENPYHNYDYDAMQGDIKTALNRLNPRQKKIICMYFGLLGFETMTLEEIGNYLELTKERVRQIKDVSLKILKTRQNSLSLKQYISYNA